MENIILIENKDHQIIAFDQNGKDVKIITNNIDIIDKVINNQGITFKISKS